MWQIGVWEEEHHPQHPQQQGCLADHVSRLTCRRLPALVRACFHLSLLSGVSLDLLIVSPFVSLPQDPLPISLRCRTALLPEVCAPLMPSLPAETVVSYGTDHRNTLTLSSLEESWAMVAVQREFLSLDGSLVERQELRIPWAGRPPELLLAETGAALLLGTLPDS